MIFIEFFKCGEGCSVWVSFVVRFVLIILSW